MKEFPFLSWDPPKTARLSSLVIVSFHNIVKVLNTFKTTDTEPSPTLQLGAMPFPAMISLNIFSLFFLH